VCRALPESIDPVQVSVLFQEFEYKSNDFLLSRGRDQDVLAPKCLERVDAIMEINLFGLDLKEVEVFRLFDNRYRRGINLLMLAIDKLGEP